MRHWLTLGLLGSAILAMVGTAAAQSGARITPEAVLTHDTPGPARLTLVSPPTANKDLTHAANVSVGTQMVVPSAKDATSLTFFPPRSDSPDDKVPVEVRDDKGVLLASATMRYVSSRHVDHTYLAILYVGLILLLPGALMVYDLVKAYRFACRTRMLIIDKAASDGLTAEELRLLLAELSQSPPGIPGLARNSIAFMLMMILAVAIVHILAVDPSGKELPASIDRILVLLTGLLTSVVSFYFGSKAAETAQQAAKASPPSNGGTKPPPITFVPKSGKPNDPVTISGTGFGAEKGTVSFGDTAADMTTAKWSDREITVRVPAAAKPGKVVVTVVPRGTDRRLASSVDFDVVGPGGTTPAADGENTVDGCDVPITNATQDRDLPAAEGGIER